ncbi:zinc finger HIT domain-containing protein 2 [Anopheles bellator]|uniref:zinc finger HIT domain-containing protein 2 n=1 Tax=Anopheles bellator TaxID=139047 RepID=UPI00264A1087|nr:zinc finger HIT domain-containing protein 2 [Anopheles bellator]
METQNCKICETEAPKYVCPRCNIPYCSVACYRSQRHLECSEGFYRENVVQELALRKAEGAADQSTQSMMAILHRIAHADSGALDNDEASETCGPEEGNDESDGVLDSDDEEEEPDLAVRLAGINLDDASNVWERLTSAEKEEFERMMENGEIMSMVPEPDLWWTKAYKVDLVQPSADERSHQEQQLLSACPPVWDKIADFNQMLPNKPSPVVRFNVANVLAGYCFVYTYFYADLHAHPLETIGCLLDVCLNLKNNTNFDTEPMAIESVVSECRNERLPVHPRTGPALKAHIRTLFEGPCGCGRKFKKLFLLAALSDVRSLLCQARQQLKQPENPSDTAECAEEGSRNDDLKLRVSSTALRGCEKKIDFYLAYAKSDYV